jgi:SsrA-binding protein
MASPTKPKETKSKEQLKEEARKRNLTLLNRKARHEYALEETYVAGMSLTGTEIKSIRLGLANLTDSFCRVQNGEVWVNNLYVAPYEQGNRYNVETRRSRKLLLHKWQITKIVTRVNERGLSIIPTKLFFENGFAKLEIGIGRGKKLWDKRESIADRDRERDQRREVFGRE